MNQNLTEKLLKWYESHKRLLPWREQNDPYKVWLSEIILQQTRVDQGLAYYNRFVNTYPDVFSLAAESQDQVLKMWQGLGYYSRARNLHKAAKNVVDQYNGKFPGSFQKLLNLPGVGQYTAAAVASIAFQEPVASVDGNVKRVISRLFGIEEAIDETKTILQIQDLANKLIDHNSPGNFNQAMMELGATICKPRNPGCEDCPVASHCKALQSNIQDKIPLKKRKIKKRTRYFYYFVMLHDSFTTLVQRGANDIWQGLYEFPLLEFQEETSGDQLLEKAAAHWDIVADSIVAVQFSKVEKHNLTHQTIYAVFVKLLLNDQPGKLNLNIGIDRLHDYPVSRLTEIYLNKDKNLL